ncbi:hypothetical protein TNCV_4561361 [Trichonephila clavipes]|nr:hypothetical protein TNCV_4561361 [Trichonephila clavipes]
MEPACDRRLQLFVVAKTLIGGQEFLEVQENEKIVGSKIRTVGWMIKQLSAKFRQNSCCASSRMWTSIAMEGHNTYIKHSSPLVLNGTSQFLQCFTITVSVCCFTTWKEVNEQNALPVPEHRAHHFPYQQRLFEFRLDQRSAMPPMH